MGWVRAGWRRGGCRRGWWPARLMRGQLGWSIGLGRGTTLPLQVPHYVLHALAMRAPVRRRRALLVADSLLVGAIAAVMGAGAVVVAQRGTEFGTGSTMPG